MTALKQLLNKNLEQFVNNIERDLLFQIIMNMRSMQTTVERAQKLAEEFMDSLPVEDKEEVIRTLKIMSEKYPEAQSLYIKYANEYFERKKYITVKKVLSHLKKGEIKRAVGTAKGGNKYD